MNPLALLEDPLRALLDFLHENMNLTYGWSIVVLTVIVRTAMLPLVIKQYQSMRSMQMVAPQLKELQRKYKGNRQKLQEETMAFYKQNEINPFASCLPLVAQIPIFIALYYVLKNFAKDATVDGGSLSFMWLVNDVRVNFTSIGWGIYILLLIYALSQLLSTELSFTPNMPDNQRRLMRLLPIGVVFFVWQFPVPAGLVLYWMTTNLWTAGQQLVMRHRDRPAPRRSRRGREVQRHQPAQEGLAHRAPGRGRRRGRRRRGRADARHAAQAPSRGRGGRGRGGRGPHRGRGAGGGARGRGGTRARARAPGGHRGHGGSRCGGRAGAGRGEARPQGQQRIRGAASPAAPEGRREGLTPRRQLPLEEEEALTGGESWR